MHPQGLNIWFISSTDLFLVRIYPRIIHVVWVMLQPGSTVVNAPFCKCFFLAVGKSRPSQPVGTSKAPLKSVFHFSCSSPHLFLWRPWTQIFWEAGKGYLLWLMIQAWLPQPSAAVSSLSLTLPALPSFHERLQRCPVWECQRAKVSS